MRSSLMQGRTHPSDRKYEKTEQKDHPSTASYLDFILQSKKNKENHFKINSKNEKYRRISDIIKMTIGSGVPLLITGKKGVGKTYLAKKVSAVESSLSQGKEAIIKCSQLPSHNKGLSHYFEQEKIDLQDLCSLVLFEVSELSLANQEELLGLLRMCNEKEGPRVIVTSSKSLTEQVQKGLFNQDLYYRLYVLHVEVPELCERKEDLPQLVQEILANTPCRENFEQVYQELLKQYSQGKVSWDLNILGLKDYLESKYNPELKKEECFVEKKAQSQETDVNREFVQSHHSWVKGIPEGMTLKDLETHYILEVLKEHQNNRTHTAKALGISLRTLRNKINQYRTEGYKVY